MSNPTDNFPSTLDANALLRMIYGGGPFVPSSTPNWSDYLHAQFAVDAPRIALAGASGRPGLDTALAAMDAPPSLATSLMAMGLGVPTSDLTEDRPPQMDPQAAQFRWLGLPPSWRPSPPKVAGAMMPAFDRQQTADDVDRKKVAPGYLQPAAAGDLRCEGFYGGCERGGDWGTTATHTVTGRKLCRKCALRMLGIEELSPAEQIKTLQRYEPR